MTQEKQYSRDEEDREGAFICPACHVHAKWLPAFKTSLQESSARIRYCPYCGYSVEGSFDASRTTTSPSSPGSSPSFIHGHMPSTDASVKFTVGPYQIIESIAQGGMGEVFLAYDTTCGRRIALKRIRTDLVDQPQLNNRFLKEARITSQLTHPAIIPIYAIHQDETPPCYTMPFVEGRTFKQILQEARNSEKEGIKGDISTSIPALVRIYFNICQAVAYAHSKRVLHRDLKPENIIVGKYGEVLILDWGLAKVIQPGSSITEEEEEGGEDDNVEEDNKEHIKEEQEAEPSIPFTHLTKRGKVVGTLAYMAPERALGHPATPQTDIFALGVTLYQILTLRLPFHRKTLKEFRKNMQNEVLADPVLIAPYRDVPPILSRIVKKCLMYNLEQRYQTVDELIHDLENYLEGRAEWYQVAELNIRNKGDWEFQENVLIAEHIAVTRYTEVTDWVTLMISRVSVTGNTKIEAEVRIEENGQGLGFLLSIPEVAERVHLNDGYCLWLTSNKERPTILLRNTVEDLTAPDVILKQNIWYRIRIEKIDNSIHFYINNVLQFSYIRHLPLPGTHIGLLLRDANFEIRNFFVFSGSHNLTVNCLAVPDAFLAHKDYNAALNEYRRIGYSFPGRAEGREAMFRAGITLLEQGTSFKDPTLAQHYYEQALLEFDKLHNTSGAPLEYLGKALVYQTLNDFEEEVKCFELAYRRYPNHPLMPILEEQVLSRMHESSRQHRLAAYRFILLVVRHFPAIAETNNAKRLFAYLQNHWEKLPFIIPEQPETAEKFKRFQFWIQLSFWLALPYPLLECVQILDKETPRPSLELGNALYCLLELGNWEAVADQLNEMEKSPDQAVDSLEWQNSSSLFQIALLSFKNGLAIAFDNFFSRNLKMTAEELRILYFLMDQSLLKREVSWIHKALACVQTLKMEPQDQLRLHSYAIWAFLWEKKWSEAEQLFHLYPMELLSKDTTILHFLYGCWLYVIEGKDIACAHFSGTLDVPYPSSWALFSHYFNDLNKESLLTTAWFKRAFLWEKRQLFRQLTLFYHCIGETEKSEYYHKLEKETYLHDIF